MRARFSGRPSARCPTRTSGRPSRWRSTTRTSPTPAASMASNTAGSSFDEGVGRNWLSITTATLVLPASSSANVGPSTGEASASRAALGRVCRPASARSDGRRRSGSRWGSRARACRGASSTRRRSRRSRAGPSTRTGSPRVSRHGCCSLGFEGLRVEARPIRAGSQPASAGWRGVGQTIDYRLAG